MLVFGFVVGLFGCDEGDIKPTTVWGIHYSDPSAKYLAAGTVDLQNDGPMTTLAIAAGYLQKTEQEFHKVVYTFSSGDSLSLFVIRRINSDVFDYPGNNEQNQLKYVLFNNDTLPIKESSVTIHPRTGENKLSTFINLQTQAGRSLDGTIGRIPLLR